ncbi:MAG: biotin synthase BioB [Alphaproteobacteria bacterium]|jgi:biotin synthase|nr:biotin synthase BioB [Alphaproteobacteria bacterium]|tara:strand:+ start:3872 stop:4828 length:957 start_codon:yes stop_codon:yes gene_type:complete
MKYNKKKILEILNLPLNDLIFKAQNVHRKFFRNTGVQLASLVSIKTGSCPEDCKYCPQSAHFNVDIKKEKLMDFSDLKTAAFKAKKNGADRFCMGAAWKKLNDGPELDSVLDMIKEVKSLGLEACVTLGSVSYSQARKLKEAGLDAYNHNIDTSPDFYKKIISTRTFEERLETIKNISDAGISVCCGGIIGMGETWEDRAKMLEVLVNLTPPPESVPLNALVPVKGTPLENQPPVNPLEMVRMVATTRIVLPKTRVRLSAGRKNFSNETQLLCLLAGANSIFYGDSLLTTENNQMDDDRKLLSEFSNKDFLKSDNNRL